VADRELHLQTLVNKTKRLSFFLGELFRRSSLYKQIKMAPFNRDDGDEDHGLDGTALILLGAKASSDGPMCGCHSDRRGM
jgi:hypothetical protein